MLSYLKEGASTTAGETAAEPSAQGPEAAFLTTAHHGRNARQGTLVLTVLFVIGAVVVWWMIKKVAPASVEAAGQEESAKIEQVLAQLNSFKSEVNGQMDSMVSRFYQASELGQISVDELKKNPFRLEMGLKIDEPSPEQLSDARRQALEDEVNLQAGRLQLWSLTERADNACCLINDKLLYVGDAIEGFEIKAIRNQRVVLERDGVQVELKMQ